MKKGNQLSVIRYGLLGLVWFSFASVFAESVTNNLDLQTNLVVNSGNVPAGDMGLTFTNPAIRGILISAGQLSGVDPETGEVITNAANLLSLKAESLMTASNITAGGFFVGDGSQLTNLNVDAFGGTISASSLPTNGVWNAAGTTISDVTLQEIIAEVSSMTNLTYEGEALSAVISNLQHQVVEDYVTQSSITVQVAEDEIANGLALISAYDQAKTKNPSVSNRVAVIVPPGRYNLGTNGLTMDAEYIDLIGLTTDREVQYLYGTPGKSNGVVRQTVSDVRIENLTLSRNASSSIMLDGSDPAAYYPTVPGSNTFIRNCEFISPQYGWWSTRLELEYAGWYENCKAGSRSFGYSLFKGSGIASGTFINCTAGALSFGADLSCGTFINCNASDESFGGDGSATGLFFDCYAGDYSFGYTNSAGVFKHCRSGNNSFSGGAAFSTNAIIINCSAGEDSFGQFNMAATNFNYNAGGHYFYGGAIKGSFAGDGSGLTNLNVAAIPPGSIDVSQLSSNVVAAAITTNDIANWNSGGALADSVQVSVETVQITTNLTVQGALEADSISASGSDGAFQFNQDGKLAGTDKLFIHEGTGKPAFYSEKGNLFRAYKNGIVADTNLIYSLRTEEGNAVLRMFENGQQTVQIKGDGTIELSGQLLADGSQLTNLAAQAELATFIATVTNSPASVITTNQVEAWDSLVQTIQNVVETVTITTNLTVQGAVEAESISAAGSEGAFQFKQNGKLAGSDKLFIHEGTGKPAFYSENGNLFRVYKNGIVTETNLIYSLREENGETVLRMFKDGEQTVQIKGDGSIDFAGQLTADGSGLTNMIAQPEVAALIDAVTNSAAITITTNDIAAWNSGGDLAESVQVSAETVQIMTNLTVQGTVTADGSALSNVAAGGEDGTLQFNENGVLSGNTNFFLHPVEKKLAFRSQNGNIFRAYSNETISDNNLIYSLRNEDGTAVLRLRQNGQDNLILSGDGSITLGGETRASWPSGGGDPTNVVTTTFTYVPPQGDLSMGVYTNGVH